MTKRELKCKVNARTLSRKKSPKPKDGESKNYHKTAGRRLKLRGTDLISSTKVGAGSNTATRRQLPMGILHKRNHRTTEMMGYNPN
jgi:hypothetical protein